MVGPSAENLNWVENARLLGTEMRSDGVQEAIRAVGGVGALARALGISQPSVSTWTRVPADRVLAVETATGVSRQVLRPDLYANDMPYENPEDGVDDVDLLRSQEYNLLAALLGRAPSADNLRRIAQLSQGEGPLGQAHLALAQAAASANPDALQHEFFALFIGVGRGELLPYGSYYLTGFLNERPLARVREDFLALGIERSDAHPEPEDHIAILCETMAGLAAGRFPAELGTQKQFFERHLKPWAERFFTDLETAKSAQFYQAVGALGRLFMEIEAEAFAMDA